ncbi:MAG TPA: putative 2OG-Fe(II) oxygenase [Burkholderiales bacterium]|nr:putative 2OG-Fe(II) oxygenase [Burkholderiales bacterium]
MPDLPLFSTPLSMYELTGMDEANREVTARLVAESRSVPSVQRSNVGGWHSRPDLALRQDAPFRAVIQGIVARVKETVENLARQSGQQLPPMRMGASAWAMVMRNGDYTIPHDHADSHWSSVYYTDAGDADLAANPDSGMLAFVDPRHGGRPMPGLDLTGSTFTAQPATGRLYVFPGWLYHYVHAYRGTRPRVCVSCNVNFEVAAPPR